MFRKKPQGQQPHVARIACPQDQHEEKKLKPTDQRAARTRRHEEELDAEFKDKLEKAAARAEQREARSDTFIMRSYEVKWERAKKVIHQKLESVHSSKNV